MNFQKSIYLLALLCCFLPFIDTPFALLLGIVLAQILKNPFPMLSKKMTPFLLQASVVGLGFGMNALQAMEAGKQGFFFTVMSIFSTLLLGLFLGKKLKIERETSMLISSGTAICGGSAIAAISTIIRSNEKQMSAALGTVFILNSIALFLFPWVGKMLNLTQHQFGVWAAIAIHDTSSVVGAAGKYGQEALQIATTIKLERALWIIPLSFLSVFVFKSDSKQVKIPYFIFLFVLAMLLNTFVPGVHANAGHIVFLAKLGLKITLFFIGSGLSRELITSVGTKPLLQGILLWLFISALSLAVVVEVL
ncbi:MAG TPA: putative sulfate exporter family transporter [Prolixibacteraceae bacterium]|nr:putative sulfate exporter family transporter [Prolixibacteraceae bacterium]